MCVACLFVLLVFVNGLCVFVACLCPGVSVSCYACYPGLFSDFFCLILYFCMLDGVECSWLVSLRCVVCCLRLRLLCACVWYVAVAVARVMVGIVCCDWCVCMYA